MGIQESAGAQHTAILGIGSYRPSRVVPNSEIVDRIDVTAAHGGQVVEWLVEDGDLVSPGQPLIRLHPEGAL